MAEEKTNYTQGYSKATVASHTSRTVDSDASFLVPYIKPTDYILDVGCGPGTITLGFRALAPQGSVIGVDISEQVLDQARKGVSEAIKKADEISQPLSRITFQKVDLLAGLPFADDSFDVVYSSQLFPHLATLDMRVRALSEMRRVLKPGGVLASRDAAELHFYPRAYDLDRLWAGNMTKALRNGEPDACFPGGDMPALFRKVGFAEGQVKVGAGTTVYSGGETRQWFVAANLGRLQAGDTFRESWRRVGITDETVEQTRKMLAKWAEDDNAWYAALQAEILGWK
ncbi:methyltransferase [Pseudomassariella vexata]|uniref:Methyltransferase n=1 Tax=Pseudomassariella vexata TaxID=1141098 RepID=A0A1Y2EFJ1_9PEZI|nr:methyltransferase [Pseudomassariella vexata]ORY70342.1 methyltransferase [Pseudomassariella vexata]